MMPKKAENCYHSEFDTSSELEQDAAFYYLTMIGVLRWKIELGRIDIISEVSLLSLRVALLREGHLDVAVHVMAHVGQIYNSILVYDPLYPEIDQCVFKRCDWSEFSMDVKEALSMNAPEPQGKEVDICMFVDSDHPEDKASCRSRNQFLVFVNTALVQWFSKKQSTV